MINIRDLRVRNWVYSSFSETPCKVTEIRLDESGYGVCRVTGVDGYKDVASLSPIPLTKEILEGNGFKEGRFGFYSYRLVDGNNYVYLNGTFTELEYKNVCYNYDDPDEVNYGSDMEFPKPLELHQLQNILRDLGIGKEIKV